MSVNVCLSEEEDAGEEDARSIDVDTCMYGYKDRSISIDCNSLFFVFISLLLTVL